MLSFGAGDTAFVTREGLADITFDSVNMLLGKLSQQVLIQCHIRILSPLHNTDECCPNDYYYTSMNYVVVGDQSYDVRLKQIRSRVNNDK